MIANMTATEIEAHYFYYSHNSHACLLLCHVSVTWEGSNGPPPYSVMREFLPLSKWWSFTYVMLRETFFRVYSPITCGLNIWHHNLKLKYSLPFTICWQSIEQCHVYPEHCPTHPAAIPVTRSWYTIWCPVLLNMISKMFNNFPGQH